MSYSKVEDGVFKTGPDDTLRTVDVYKEGGIEATAFPKHIKDALSDALGDVSSAIDKIDTDEAAIENTEYDIAASEVEPAAAKKAIDTPLPPEVKPEAIIRNAPPDTTLTELNKAIAEVYNATDFDSYMDVDTQTLSTQVNAIISLDKANLLEDYADVVTQGLDTATDVLGILVSKADTAELTDKISNLPVQLQTHVGGELKAAAALVGDLDTVAAINDELGGIGTKVKDLDIVSEALSNFTLPTAVTDKDYTTIATDLMDNVKKISPDLIDFDKSGEAVKNITALKDISDDAKKILDYDYKTISGDFISDLLSDTPTIPAKDVIDTGTSALLGTYNLLPENIVTLGNRAYKHLQL